jgi:Arc/MetJ-type ribon-helix-helix transcriptional regulator
MATQRLTVTLAAEQTEQILQLVGTGNEAEASAFVEHAVAVVLDDVADWEALLAEALRSTGGPLTDEERAWADEILQVASSV